MTNRKKVVILGGGTGSSRVLMSLKDLPFDITSVVTVSDDGRSTGVLRKEFTAPGMGDIRKVLSNLSTLPDEVKDIMEYRFSTYSDLNNHSVGNLVLTAYMKKTGSLEESIEYYSKLLRVKQTVLPLSEDNLVLMGETTDGEIIEGEAELTDSGKKFERIFNIFDGNNSASLTQARQFWKELKAADIQIFYWKQDDMGKWIQAA